MATTKVSELAALTTPDGAEELLINDGGTSKKITIANAIIAGTGITKSGATISASPVALTTVQTAANQSAQLALTTEEGDVVVRTDESKTYMHNGGSAGNMNDFTEMATPTGGVTSVNSVTGAVTAAHIATAVEAASDSNTFTDADHSKLNAIEASADVTDATNVTAAGALMDSEVTNLAEVKAFAASDYATAAQGTTANAALPKAGGTMTGDLVFGDNVKATFGAGADLEIYHQGTYTYIHEKGTGELYLRGTNIVIKSDTDNDDMAKFITNGAAELYYSNAKKIETTATGVTVTGDIANASGTLTIDSASDIKLDADGSAIHLLDGGTHMGTIKMANSNINLDSQVVDKDIIFSGNDGGSAITALTLDMSDGGAATFNGYADFQGNNIYLADNGKAVFGTGEDLKIYHDGSNSYISEQGTGDLKILATSFEVLNAGANKYYLSMTDGGALTAYHNGAAKLATTAEGITVTGEIKTDAGSGGSPSHTFTTDTDSGMFSGGANILSFATGSLERCRIENDGDFHADGDVIAYSTTISDERLKHDIEPIKNALSKVNTLKGCTFTYTPDGKKSAGLIAQDVEKVLPSAVSESTLPLKIDDGKEYKILQYDQTIGLLVEAIKELSEKVEKLENK